MKLVDHASIPTVLTLVGAGGKSSLMSALASEMLALGKTVIMTTTTKMYAPDSVHVPQTLLTNQKNFLVSLREQLLKHSITCIGSTLNRSSGKLIGVNPEQVKELKQFADFTFVEADGAAGMGVKGTEDWEPVIPSCSDCVFYVIGLDCIGKPANSLVVHKLDKFLKQSGLQQDEPISLRSLARLVNHDMAGLKRVPKKASLYVVLNKSDRLHSIKVAMELGSMMLSYPSSPIKGVIVTGLFSGERRSFSVAV